MAILGSKDSFPRLPAIIPPDLSSSSIIVPHFFAQPKPGICCRITSMVKQTTENQEPMAKNLEIIFRFYLSVIFLCCNVEGVHRLLHCKYTNWDGPADHLIYFQNLAWPAYATPQNCRPRNLSGILPPEPPPVLSYR